MLDPSLFQNPLVQTVLKALWQALGPHLAAKLFAKVTPLISPPKDIVKIGSPEELRGMIASGRARAGQWIEGTGFFSLLTAAYGVKDPGQGDGISILPPSDELIFGSGESRSLVSWEPVVQFPHLGAYRVAFLYPHSMWGFGRYFGDDGTTATLPFLSRQIIVVREDAWTGMENRIVKFRARLVALGPDDIRAAYPSVTEDDYDELRRKGILYLLDGASDGAFMEDYDRAPLDAMFGAHFLTKHWELADFSPDRFRGAVDAGVAQTCIDLQLGMHPALVSELGPSAGAAVWPEGRLEVFQLPGVPAVSIEMRTDFRSSEAANRKQAFLVATRNVLRAVESEFGASSTSRDVDSVDQRSMQEISILQSAVARSVDSDPILGSVRRWVEKPKS